MPPVSATSAPVGAIQAKTSQRFQQLRRRARRGIFTEAGAIGAVALVAYAAVSYLVDRNLRLETPVRAVLLGVLVVWLVRMLRGRLFAPLRVFLDDDEMALAVERQDPALRQALISSMQFDRALGSGTARGADSHVMMSAVVTDVHDRLASLPFHRALDGKRIRKFAAILSLCLTAFVGWGIVDGEGLVLWAKRNLALSSVEWPRYTKLFFLDTGGATIRLPQGDPYTVRLGVGADGPRPDQVFLYYEFAGGESGSEQMSRTGDGEYTLTLESLLENATLHAEGGDGLSDDLHIEIVERPRLDYEIEIVYPEYMEKENEIASKTDGEVRLLRGSRLLLSGRSHKTIKNATVQIGRDNGNTTQLTVAADRHAFAGELVPKAGGLLEINVVDDDELGAGAPPRLVLHVVDDKEPRVDLKLRGISAMITAQARIPGDLVVTDDFGINEVKGGLRAIIDTPPPTLPRDPQQPGETQPGEGQPEQVSAQDPEAPFEPAEVVYGDGLSRGVVRYETTASIDLKQFNEVPDQDDPANRIRPGMLLSIRYSSKDNFGPAEPHESFSEVLTFRVVTRDKLVDELRRRQVEQRIELEQIRDDEQNSLLSLRETDINPVSSHEKAAQARARFKTLSRRQQSLGRRVKFVGETYQRILWEYENNRVWEPSKAREIEALTSVVLAHLAKEPFPVTSRQVNDFSDSGDEATKADAVEGYERILARIDAVIKVMEQTETLAALLEQLRGVIKQQDGAIQAVDQQVEKAATDIFTPSGGQPDKPAPDKPRKPSGGGNKDENPK